MLLAIPLYHYSIFTLGLPLLAFFVALLVMGWALGLIVCALILRHGMGAETIAWLAIFILAPVSAVYYPVTVLPGWLQAVGATIPAMHVFEGMRAVMFEHSFRWDHFLWASGLDLFYILLGFAAFLYAFRGARRRGALLQVGE
jgi:ABC-2 type transport system permease protein